MLQLVRNNSPFTAIFLFLITLLLHAQVLVHPVYPPEGNTAILYVWVLNILHFVFGKSSFAFTFFAILLVYFQALFTNAIANKHKLFKDNSFLVAFSFLALNSLFPAFGQFNPQLFVNFFILVLFDQLFILKTVKKTNKHYFNIGFLVTISMLFNFSSIFLLLFTFFALLVLMPFSIKDWMILLLGLIMPLYIVAVILFSSDHLAMFSKLPMMGVSLPASLYPPQYFLGLLSGIIVWFSISIYNIKIQMRHRTIQIRRNWIVISAALLFTFLTAILSSKNITAPWAICLPILALLLTNAFYNDRNKKMNTISFYFALILVIFCQLFLPI